MTKFTVIKLPDNPFCATCELPLDLDKDVIVTPKREVLCRDCGEREAALAGEEIPEGPSNK